jgi:hypothetical protein
MAIHNTKVTFKTIKSDIYKSDSAIREAVANAIDAESKNVYLSVYEEQIKGSLDSVFKYFCLDIADDGNGIPMEEDEFEKVFCQYKVSTKNEKTNYGRRGKGRYTYLTATRDPSNVIIFTKNKTKWYQVKFEANETDNIQITNVKIDSKPSTNIKKNFTTLVQLKDLDINKFELDEVNIEQLIQEIKAEIISFFADRIASKSIKIYVNNELLKIDSFLERKVFTKTFKIPMEELEASFSVDFYIWNESIKLKADRQKHILFLDSHNTLKGIAPSGKNKLSIANQKQNHTIIVKSKYLNDLDFMDSEDKYNSLLTDKTIEKLRKHIAIELEYVLFDIYKKHLDKVADDYLSYLTIEKDQITTQVYHTIMYPFIEKFGNKKIPSEIKGVIAKLIDTLLKESPDSYLSNIKTILNLSEEESKKIFYIEENYGIIKAIADKEKYIARIDILNNFDEMVNGKKRRKVKERTMLHHVIDKNLWIIDEEFEDITYGDIASDVSLKTILENPDFYQFDSDELIELTKDYNLKKVPDIYIPIHKNNIIYIIELKKPTVKIKQSIVGEIMSKYTDTLQEINQKLPESERKRLYAIAISDAKTGTVYTVGDLEKDGVRIEPMTWKEVIDKTRERYRQKIKDLDHKIKSSHWMSMEDFIQEWNEV